MKAAHSKRGKLTQQGAWEAVDEWNRLAVECGKLKIDLMSQADRAQPGPPYSDAKLSLQEKSVAFEKQRNAEKMLQQHPISAALREIHKRWERDPCESFGTAEFGIIADAITQSSRRPKLFSEQIDENLTSIQVQMERAFQRAVPKERVTVAVKFEERLRTIQVQMERAVQEREDLEELYMRRVGPISDLDEMIEKPANCPELERRKGWNSYHQGENYREPLAARWELSRLRNLRNEQVHGNTSKHPTFPAVFAAILTERWCGDSPPLIAKMSSGLQSFYQAPRRPIDAMEIFNAICRSNLLSEIDCRSHWKIARRRGRKILKKDIEV